MKKDFFLNLAVGVMAVCALLVTALVVRREFFHSPEPASSVRARVDGWQQFASRGSRIGASDARVTLVEFSDFQCPFCKMHAATLDRVRRKYPKDLAIIYRHFPIRGIHPHAETAALASECAGDHGRFEAFHDALYDRQDSIGVAGWDTFARAAGITDIAAFQACLEDRRYQSRIDEDEAAARKLGITSTPTSIINGWKISGTISEAELDGMIAEALRAAETRR